MLVDRRWRRGDATLMPEDDPVQRSRTLPHRWDAAIGRPISTQPLTVRIGYQCYSLLMLLKSRGTFESALAGLGADVEWVSFPGGLELIEAFRRLPTRQREVLALRYYVDMSVADAAATLHISEGAVRSTASRGLDALARILPSRSSKEA